MYCSHFGLHRPPFNNTPDPTFYYSTPEHEEALATLQYATFQRKGFVLVTGEIGAGKTLIGRMFLRQVDRNAAVAVITHTNLTGRQLLAAICAEFELDVPPDASNLQLAERLQNFLLDQFAKDRFAVVVLDEAQNLPDESFEELRMLGNLEADDAKLLQICILGQPELRERFRHPKLKPMNQRLFRRFHLPSLNREHMEGYILHRLKVAGCTRKELFTPGAIDLIYAASQGTPRLINQICDNALLTAYGEGAGQVDEHIVNLATEKESPPAPAQTPPSEAVDAAPSPAAEHPTTPAPAAPQVVVQAGMVHEAIDKSNTSLELAQRQADQIAQSQDGIRAIAEQTIRTKEEQQAVVEQACRQYQAAQEKLDAYRSEIQGTFDEAVGQYQSIRRQFEELSQTAVPAFELEQVRQAHLRETGRMLEEISQQRAEFKRLLETANQKWNETQDQVIELANESTSGTKLADLESEFEDRLRELLTRLDQQRKHIANLAQVFHDQCLQTRNDLQELREAQEQADSRLAEEMERKLAETRADLDAKIGQHEERIGSLNQHIADQLAATDKALSQLETDSATTADLEQAREEQTAAIRGILQQLNEQASRLAGFKAEITQQAREASEKQGTLINEVSDRVTSQSDRLQRLRQKALQYFTLTEKRFAALHEQFADRAEVEELRRNQQLTTEQLRNEHQETAEQLRSEQQSTAQELIEQQQVAADELRAEQQTATEKLHVEHQETTEQLRNEQQELREAQEQADSRLAEEMERKLAETQADLDARIGQHEERIGSLNQHIADQLAATDKALSQLETDSATTADLEQAREEQTAAIRGILQQLNEQADGLAGFRDEITQQAREASEKQGTLIDEVGERVTSQSDRLQRLRQKALQYFTLTEKRFAALHEQFADRAEVEELRRSQQLTTEQLRSEQQSTAEGLLEQQRVTTGELRAEQQTTAERLRTEHQETAEQIRSEQQSSAEGLLEQQRVVADGLRQCHRADMDELRETHDVMAADMLHRIEMNRKTTKRLIGSVVNRFRSTREQLDALITSHASQEQLDELRSQQEAESKRLLQQLESQEQVMAEQFEHVGTRLQQTAQEIETLSATTAQTTQLEELRQHHADDRERILATLAAQRRDLESLVASVSARCEEMTGRLNTLPDDIATAGQIDAIREEHTQQVRNVLNELAERKSQLEQAIASVADHCDQTHAAVNALAKHAASAEDVRQLREQHTHKLREMLQRMDQQDTRHDGNVGVLTRKIKDNVRRVTQLEEKGRPKPIRIELTPKAGTELGQIVEAAQQQHGHLCEAADRAGAIASHLHNASSQVQEALQHWVENADQVQEQSDKLRTSAKMASRILKAMEKCHAVLDKKLNSHRWQAELARGEKLADRLEQASNKAVAVTQQLDQAIANRIEQANHKAATVTDQLHAALRDFDQCQETAEDWTRKRKQAERTSEQLSKLLGEATSVGSKFDQALTQRKRMLTAVAQNTARLMEFIEAARQGDEPQPTARQAASKTKKNLPDEKRVRDLDWPKFRTHPTIQVG